MPSWLISILPKWLPIWVAQLAFSVLLNEILPAAQVAAGNTFGPLIGQLITWLKGGPLGTELRTELASPTGKFGFAHSTLKHFMDTYDKRACPEEKK